LPNAAILHSILSPSGGLETTTISRDGHYIVRGDDNHDGTGLNFGPCELGQENKKDYAKIPHLSLHDSFASTYFSSQHGVLLTGYKISISWNRSDWFEIVAVREEHKGSK